MDRWSEGNKEACKEVVLVEEGSSNNPSTSSGKAQDVYVFFQGKAKEWLNRSGWNSYKEGDWWIYIEKDFIIIFGRVIRRLGKIYRRRKYHGCLCRSCIRVDRFGEARFTSRKCSLLRFEVGVEGDFKALKQIWTTILALPFRVPFDLKNYGLPEDLVELMEELSKPLRPQLCIRFLIDVPTFWSRGDKVRFVDKFCELDNMRLLKSFAIYTEARQMVPFPDEWIQDILQEDTCWRIYITKGDLEYVTDMNGERVLDELEKPTIVGSPRNRYGDRFILFMKNTTSHYNEERRVNDSQWEPITKKQIQQLLAKTSETFARSYFLIRGAIMRRAIACHAGGDYWILVQKELLSENLDCSSRMRRFVARAKADGTWGNF